MGRAGYVFEFYENGFMFVWWGPMGMLDGAFVEAQAKLYEEMSSPKEERIRSVAKAITSGAISPSDVDWDQWVR